jgi:tetratricopeptide (TPR) repeat protein
MKKFSIIIKIFFIYLFLISGSFGKESNYLKKGIDHFKKKEFDKSKFFFERDIVFDPKSEKSYLYLAKIFNSKKNDYEEEINLNSVLLLNPKNDEAIYMLALLKIKQSDYNHVKKLLDEFILVCKSFCSKKKEIKEKFDKMTPEDAKNNS